MSINSVDLFTNEEHVIIADWLGVEPKCEASNLPPSWEVLETLGYGAFRKYRRFEFMFETLPTSEVGERDVRFFVHVWSSGHSGSRRALAVILPNNCNAPRRLSVEKLSAMAELIAIERSRLIKPPGIAPIAPNFVSWLATGARNLQIIDGSAWRPTSMFTSATREVLGNVVPTRTPMAC